MNSVFKKIIALCLSLLMSFSFALAVSAEEAPGTDEPAEPAECTLRIEGVGDSMELKYRESYTFTAAAENLPEGGVIMWVVNDELIRDYTGETYTVESANGSFDIKAIAVDGKLVIANSQLVKVTVKVNFFIRLITFLKILFKGIPILRIRIEKDS